MIPFLKRSVLYGSFLGMIMQSSAQEAWVQIGSPTSSSLQRLHFIDNLTGWAAGQSGTIIHTTNSGQSWVIQSSGVETNIHNIFFLNENLGWALTWTTDSPYRTLILETTDGGASWITKVYGQDNIFMNTIFFLDSLNGWMGGFGGVVVKTTNGGLDWTPTVSSGLCSGLPVLDFLFHSSQYAFANGGARDLVGVIWRTTNYGEEWSSVCLGPEPIQQLHVFDSLNIIGVGGDFEYGSSVVRTTDGGSSWNYTALQVFGVASALSFRTGSEGWAPLGFAQEFIRTLDSGKTWSQVPTPGRSSILDLVFTDSSHGYAVGSGGVILRYDSSLVNVAEDDQRDFPKTYRLHQNYPNPFNPTTTIEFSLPRQSFVQLKVYNLMGQEVATIVSENLAAGTYSKQWDAAGVGGGMYLYRLITKDFVETRKMIVLK